MKLSYRNYPILRLFDQNCYKQVKFRCDFENLSEEELAAKGLNDSLSHTDFMIGSEDLSIDGITASGETIAIFRDGTWAF